MNPFQTLFRRAVNLPRRLFGLHPLTNHQPESPESLLGRLDEPFRSALLSLYRGQPQLGNDGKLHEIDSITGIDAANGMWLYDDYRRRGPRASLEIGMAYGCSTLFFLAAIAKNGAGSHTAIDPFEPSYWHGIGDEKVRQVGSNAFRFIGETDYHAAADLARAHSAFDFIFIDGSHRFDDALVDFTLFAPLLNTGGLIVFDDMWMPSVRTAVAFVQTNRHDFKQVPAPDRFAAFERIADDTRLWNHFVPFAVEQQ
ncbi:MAG: O-methyltransferase, family 3 [Candidatus Acidoferrum typicum]|nr:O-methyltransferase, family 3 [Candidatus Acidoferrum typicum]